MRIRKIKMKANPTYDILIAGAGISGLAAGKYLNDRGMSVKILDKGKAVGGRLATKRLEFNDDKLKFDYGARFLEANSSDFKNFINQLLEDDIARIWHVNSNNQGLDNSDVTEKYTGKKSMREIAFYLSNGLDISSDTRVELINWDKDFFLPFDKVNKIPGLLIRPIIKVFIGFLMIASVIISKE